MQEQKENYFVQGSLAQTSSLGLLIWKVMQRNVLSDVVSWRTKINPQMYIVTTPCLDDYQFKEYELGAVGEL